MAAIKNVSPLVLAVSLKYIAVGFKQGLVMIFDRITQRLLQYVNYNQGYLIKY